jgi:hypothetical protein
MSNKNQNTFLLGDQMSNFSVPAPPRPPSCLCRLSAIATPTLQRHSHSNGGSNPHIRPCLSQQNSTFGMHSQESFAGKKFVIFLIKIFNQMKQVLYL